MKKQRIHSHKCHPMCREYDVNYSSCLQNIKPNSFSQIRGICSPKKTEIQMMRLKTNYRSKVLTWLFLQHSYSIMLYESIHVCACVIILIAVTDILTNQHCNWSRWICYMPQQPHADAEKRKMDGTYYALGWGRIRHLHCTPRPPPHAAPSAACHSVSSLTPFIQSLHHTAPLIALSCGHTLTYTHTTRVYTKAHFCTVAPTEFWFWKEKLPPIQIMTGTPKTSKRHSYQTKNSPKQNTQITKNMQKAQKDKQV